MTKTSKYFEFVGLRLLLYNVSIIHWSVHTHSSHSTCLCALFLQSLVEDLQLFAFSTQALLCDQDFSIFLNPLSPPPFSVRTCEISLATA